jgi:hypothetical protein
MVLSQLLFSPFYSSKVSSRSSNHKCHQGGEEEKLPDAERGRKTRVEKKKSFQFFQQLREKFWTGGENFGPKGAWSSFNAFYLQLFAASGLARLPGLLGGHARHVVDALVCLGAVYFDYSGALIVLLLLHFLSCGNEGRWKLFPWAHGHRAVRL